MITVVEKFRSGSQVNCIHSPKTVLESERSGPGIDRPRKKNGEKVDPCLVELFQDGFQLGFRQSPFTMSLRQCCVYLRISDDRRGDDIGPL